MHGNLPPPEILIGSQRDPFHSQEIQILYKSGYLHNYEVVEMTPDFMEDGLVTEPAAGTQYSYLRTMILAPGGCYNQME